MAATDLLLGGVHIICFIREDATGVSKLRKWVRLDPRKRAPGERWAMALSC